MEDYGCGGDKGSLAEIERRVADGYQAVSEGFAGSAFQLALNDLRYVLSSHDGQFRRGATAMRNTCSSAAKQHTWAEATRRGISAQTAIELSDFVQRVLNSITLDAAAVEECSWYKDAEDEGDTWETGCGKAFRINDGSPSYNNMNFCFFCGRAIKEDTTHEAEDAEAEEEVKEQ